jgi:hypothetical protein
MSAAPGGRLWLAFDDQGDDIHAVATNGVATKFGENQLVKTPKHSTVYEVGIEGSTGRADIVFNNGTAILHTQALYGLTVKATPGKLIAGRPGHLTDAGDAVKGAKVKALGHSCQTDRHGRCSVTLPPRGPGAINVRASAGGYADGSVRVKVKR